MNQQRITSMEEQKMERLSLEVYDYLEHIKQIMNEMEEVVSKTKECFDCESGNYYRQVFQESHSKNKTIIENIGSIAEDIILAKNVYYHFDKKIHNDIKTEIENLDIPVEYDLHVTINDLKD